MTLEELATRMSTEPWNVGDAPAVVNHGHGNRAVVVNNYPTEIQVFAGQTAGTWDVGTYRDGEPLEDWGLALPYHRLQVEIIDRIEIHGGE